MYVSSSQAGYITPQVRHLTLAEFHLKKTSLGLNLATFVLV